MIWKYDGRGSNWNADMTIHDRNLHKRLSWIFQPLPRHDFYIFHIISSYLNTYFYFVATFVILSKMVCWCFFVRYPLSTTIDLQCPNSQALSAFSQLPTSPLVDWGNDFRWSWGMPCLPSFFARLRLMPLKISMLMFSTSQGVSFYPCIMKAFEWYHLGSIFAFRCCHWCF